MRGLFISVEGIDGAGKSTHVAFIREYLEDKGFQVVVTREPGGTKLGEKIRDILLHSDSDIHPITELCLLFASRQELISQVIEPNLANGICVIADRFIDASIAYQAYGRNIGRDKLDKIVSLLEPSLITDLTFLFDVPLDMAFNRVSKNKQKDRIEQENSDFFATVQNAYRMIADNEPERVKVITTNQVIEKTQILLASYLSQLIRRHSTDD
jgi:dTMP kinase